MSAHNQRVLEESFAKAKRQAEAEIVKNLLEMCARIIADAYQTRTFLGFTGNTQTSYACGLYKNGTLEYVTTAQDDGLALPIRVKVKKGEFVYLPQPYEGNARKVTGKVEVDSFLGSESSRHFLETYQAPKEGYSIVVCTGTEYSLYLEQVRHFDVLSQTLQDVPVFFEQTFKR